MDYRDKYIEYKTKYFKLKNINIKNNMLGGSAKLIIHISGPSGVGKTTLGKKLESSYSNKIVVKDIDDLQREFIKDHYAGKKWEIIDKDAYQKYINNYINKINKPLIFVGLNHMPWWHKELYYDMHSTHNFYINLNDETIIKQKCIRHLRKLSDLENNETAMNNLINNNEKFIRLITKRIKNECDVKLIINRNKKLNEDYKKQGYIFLSREEIYDKVCGILDKNKYK